MLFGWIQNLERYEYLMKLSLLLRHSSVIAFATIQSVDVISSILQMSGCFWMLKANQTTLGSSFFVRAVKYLITLQLRKDRICIILHSDWSICLLDLGDGIEATKCLVSGHREQSDQLGIRSQHHHEALQPARRGRSGKGQQGVPTTHVEHKQVDVWDDVLV